MQSKEESVLELFLEQPTKEWHFEEIQRVTKLARSKVDQWLKRFVQEKLIKRVKEVRKMPYYLGNYESAEYQNKKRLNSFQKLYNSGFLNHLSSLEKAQTVIVFGSFVRSDWSKESDVDVFIYGDPQGLKIATYELKLEREIQLFICRDKTDLQKLGVGLIKNIIKGNLIKGDLDFIKVELNA